MRTEKILRSEDRFCFCSFAARTERLQKAEGKADVRTEKILRSEDRLGFCSFAARTEWLQKGRGKAELRTEKILRSEDRFCFCSFAARTEWLQKGRGKAELRTGWTLRFAECPVRARAPPAERISAGGKAPRSGGRRTFFKKSEQTLPRQQAAEILERGFFSPMIRAHRSDHRRSGRTLTAQFRKSPRIFRSDFLRIFSGSDFQWFFQQRVLSW